MKKITLLVVLCSFLLGSQLYAQNTAQISGRVSTKNGVAIPGATIHLLNSNFIGVADNDGKYVLRNVPTGKYTIGVRALNYATLTREINLSNQQMELNFELKQQGHALEEVIVTAEKREESSQNLPLSISAISARQAEEYRLWNIKQISGIVPNLYSANPGDNRNVTSIRGIVSSSYDPAVATYVDGVNQFNLDTYIAQLQDVERIEVLRGPSGTLYGRNAMGGVINIITKQPCNNTSGFAEVNSGNFNQQRYNLGFRTPLVKDRLFFGASGLYTKQEGFYTNEFTNSSFDNQHSTMGNYYLKFLASSKLSLSLNVKHNENRNNGAFPLVSSIENALNTPFTLNQNNIGPLVDNIFNTSLSLNYAGSGFNFTSQSAYQTNYRYYKQPVDADFSPIDGYSIVNNYGRDWNNVKALTQEFRFSSSASSASAFKWVGGTYLFYQDNPVKQGIYIGDDGTLVGAPFNNFTSINTNKTNSYGIAFFAQGTYSLTPKLDLIAGLRYDFEHKKQSIKGEFQPDGAELMETRSDTSATARFNAFSPKAGIQYHLTAQSNLYGTYSRGFRAGGISQLSSNPDEAPLRSYEPEFSNSFEIGSKNMFFGNKARVNLALFYTIVNNAQVPTLILPDAITVTQNAGKLISKGAELELGLNPLQGLELDYNFGYTDAKYKRLNLPSNGTSANFANNKQMFTPDITSMLAVQYGYQLSESKNLKLVVRGEWRYTGKQYFDLENQLQQSAYSLLNGRAGVSTQRFDVFVWGSNLADERYIDYAYNFGAAHLGNPRTYGMSFRVRY